MNPKVYLFVILLMTLFLLKFCNIPDASPDPKQIHGTWIWLESVGGFAGHRLTPDTEKYSKFIWFSENYNYYEFKNDQLVRKTNYDIEYGDEIVLKFADQNIENRIGFKSNDTLIIRENCMDCYIHTFIRDHD